MAFEIKKVYKQEIPALRFIGVKQYFNNGWDDSVWDAFNKIETSLGKSLETIYEDGNAYCSLYKHDEGEQMEYYYAGIFTPEGSKVPDGLFYRDFVKSTLGVCWIYGKQNEVHGHWSECKKIIEEKGHEILYDTDGAHWHFERDGCPRFTTPDEKGNVITDVCYYIK
jgi:predicted transcriptional regulator YdeE